MIAGVSRGCYAFSPLWGVFSDSCAEIGRVNPAGYCICQLPEALAVSTAQQALNNQRNCQIINLISMLYPQIVVTGDSISQQSFRVGGYGAALVDEVATTRRRLPLTLTLSPSLQYSTTANSTFSIGAWEDGTHVNCSHI